MRLSFLDWATATNGLYLYDRQPPALAQWQTHQVDILNHVFPGGEAPLPYSRVIWSDVKKSGKSELAAGLHLWFALFVDAPGEQFALANDLEGAQSRVWRYVVGSLEKAPSTSTEKLWRTRGTEIVMYNGSRIRAIASDYRGEAGANFSLATVDEPWGIVYESGVRLMTEFSPVPTRPNSTVFYTGYQGWLGQSTYWHDLIDSVRMGEPVPELAHIDNGNGEPACWRNGRSFLYWNHRPRMPWHTPAFLEEQRRALPLSEYLRVWENRRAMHTDAFCTADQWDWLYDPALRRLAPGDKRPVVLAADVGLRADCTALVGCAWNTELQRAEVVYSSIWQPPGPAGPPLRLTETLGPEILRLHHSARVVAVLYDPYQMAAIAELCQRAGVPMVEFPQTAERIRADTHLHQLLWGSNLAHTGDQLLREHVISALARTTERGLRLAKELSSARIDGAVALSMAALGAAERLASTRLARLQVSPNPFFPP